MYKINYTKTTKKLRETSSQLASTQSKSNEYKNIIQEMGSEVKTLQTAYKDLMGKHV